MLFSKRYRRFALIAGTIALMWSAAQPVGAQTASVTALTGQSCAGTRFGSDLGCTANDFSSALSFDQPAATALASCRAGQTVNIDVIAQITSNSPLRYDGAYFIGEAGNSPQLNDATKTCSVGVFPNTPLPFLNTDLDTCGDYSATSSSTLLIKSVAVKCTPATGTNTLAIPYVLVFNNLAGATACTPATVTANTKSKCVASVTATVTGVTVNGYIQITKQTLPDGHSQSFGFTGTSSTGATVTPSSFSLGDGQTQIVEVPFASGGASANLTLGESAIGGWDPTASITCTTPTGASASSYVTVNNSTRTISATLSPTDFGAVCTITNTKIPTVAVQKTSVGGTGGPFAFSQVNLVSTPASITTTALNTATPASPAAIQVSTLNTAVSLTESAVSGYRLTSASCTDTASALTGNIGSIGTLTTSTLAIPSTAVKPGAVFNCVFTNAKIPTFKIQKITTGGFGGPFSFAQTNLASTPAAISTTANNTAAPVSPTAIEASTIGSAVSLTETVASGYQLVSASCADANSAVTGNTGAIGTLSGSTLNIPAANVVAGSDFSCTFTNRKIPTVKLQKISQGGTSTFGFSASSNLASTPSSIATATAGTAAPAAPAAINVTTIATAVTVTESAVAGYALTGFSCTDANSAVTGNTGTFGSFVAATRVVTIPAANIVAGADLTCVLTNTKAATVKLQKITAGGSGGPFSFTQTNLASTPAAITTTAPATAAPAAPAAIAVTALGTAVQITESALASGYQLASASCTDANSAVTGNTGAIGTLSGSTLTIPAANVVAGADFSCTFTNRKTPTVKLQKITTGGFGGPFSFTQTNLASTPAAITTTAALIAAPVSPTAIDVSTIGTAVQITEASLPAGYQLATASCSDANSAVTGNTGAIGTLSGSTLTIPAANVVAGADLSCTFTNSKIPTVKLQKTSIGGTGTFSFSTSANLASAPISIVTASAGTAAPLTPTAINVSSIGTAVSVTESAVAGYALTGFSCTDANSAVTGNTGTFGSFVAATQVASVPAANIVAGADLTCVLTNTKTATVKLQKISQGGTGTFSFSGSTNLASTPSSIVTVTVGIVAPASPAAITITTLSTPVTVTESAVAGYALTAFSCTDANSAITGNTGTFGSFVAAAQVATVPAANIVAGADITCALTNRKAPTFKVQKITRGGFGGPFSFSQTGLVSAPAAISTTADNVAAPVSPTAIAAVNVSSAVSLTETVASGYQLVSASCTDANSAVTGNTGAIGTLSGSTLNISAANVVAGADFTCAFTNDRRSDLVVTKTVSDTTPDAGQTITYTLGVTNNGPVAATNISLVDVLPAGLTYVSHAASGSTTWSNVTGMWTIGTLNNGQSATLTITATVNAGTAGSVITNTIGSVSLDQLDTNTTPDDLSEALTVNNVLAITISKAATFNDANGNLRPDAGETITYAFSITNTGTAALTNVSVSDPLPGIVITGTPIASLAPGATNTSAYSATYTLTQANIDSGSIGNRATVTATPPVGPAITDLSDDPANPADADDPTDPDGEPDDITTVALAAVPRLSVVKTASLVKSPGNTLAGFAQAGDTINYTYVITNTGNVTFTNVEITDVHNGGGTFADPLHTGLTDNGTAGDSPDSNADAAIWGKLAPGDVVTFATAYTVIQNDVDTLQ